MEQAQEDEIVLKVRSYPDDVQVDILFSDFVGIITQMDLSYI